MRARGSALCLGLVAAVICSGAGPCETVDLGPPPADVNACRPSQQFFIDEIWPNVLAKDYGGKHCYDASCHDMGSGRPLTLTVVSGPGTIPFPADWALDYRSASEQMNCSNVSASDLLSLPTGQRTHGGGKLFDVNDPEALAIQMWPTVQP